MYVYMHSLQCIYIYMYTCINMYAHIYTHSHTNTLVCVQTYIYININTQPTAPYTLLKGRETIAEPPYLSPVQALSLSRSISINNHIHRQTYQKTVAPTSQFLVHVRACVCVCVCVWFLLDFYPYLHRSISVSISLYLLRFKGHA